MRNKPPKPRIVHFLRPWKYATMTECGQTAFERAAVSAEPRGAQRVNILASGDPNEVTCGSCLRTNAYKRAKEKAMSPKHEATVGIPTQGSESDMLERPINMGAVMTEASRMLGHNESFGPTDPVIHAAAKRGNPTPLCVAAGPDDRTPHEFEGYSTMDGGVINCRECLQHPEFIRRNNMFTEMMSPTLPATGPAPVVAQYHDREPEEDYGQPLYNHDCEACTFLGSKQGQDLYYCDQGGGSNLSTVIARRSDRGEDYISGLSAARQEPLLALAVVRAFRKGLLTDDEMGWL